MTTTLPCSSTSGRSKGEPTLHPAATPAQCNATTSFILAPPTFQRSRRSSTTEIYHHHHHHHHPEHHSGSTTLLESISVLQHGGEEERLIAEEEDRRGGLDLRRRLSAGLLTPNGPLLLQKGKDSTSLSHCKTKSLKRYVMLFSPFSENVPM